MANDLNAGWEWQRRRYAFGIPLPTCLDHNQASVIVLPNRRKLIIYCTKGQNAQVLLQMRHVGWHIIGGDADFADAEETTTVKTAAVSRLCRIQGRNQFEDVAIRIFPVV